MSSSIWLPQSPSWSFLRCRSCVVSTCLPQPLFDAEAPPSRVKHCESRRISGNEKAVHVCRIRQDRWTAGISQLLGYDFCRAERGKRMAHINRAWSNSARKARRRSFSGGAAYTEQHVLGWQLSDPLGERRARLSSRLATRR